ncbi:TIGR03619 family F420-dependent LLM class oxidoreductase [Tsukamurella soli]|uniref:TIGR03619 family F420-dependent LLM class oxidoreductase n=1 Tax=Tsukamurella soli TaxID=644556 RepID=UPI0031ED12C4
MRFTYAEAMTDPAYYIPLAQAAEAAGYTSMVVADSIAYPEESDATYPYTPGGDREFLDGKAFVETFVLSAALAASTSTLRFTPFVLKLPIRPPVLVAKQAGSLAFLSGDRFSLGVGISPWPEDFAMMGVPFGHRGRRMDECIEVVRGLCTGEYFEYHGEFVDIPRIKLTPAPRRPMPILVGGHSDAALRRAVRLGDGWMHAGGDAGDLDRMLGRIAELEAQRDVPRTLPFEVHVISLDAYTVDGVKRLEDRGVTDVIVGFRVPYQVGPDTESLQKKVDHLRRYADTVITRFA